MKTYRQRAAIFIATGLGSGYLPWAPGTWGAFAMALIAWGFLELPLWGYCAILACVVAVGVSVAGIADAYFTQHGGRKHDNKQIVIDEWAGMMITFLPLFYFEKNVLNVAVGFLLFRIFDTLKFGVAKIADRWANRWGVILDDVFAGLHAAIFFFLALWVMYRM
ncbi:MAG: phosphatidylglycerophosphatase A [Patescibacteria group bacterium]|nr:phosphatidylglycerophosphatase A [Patescibacteria group bacterium]MDD5715668.1 phosphatidylglycerophosphatase A [Patescibacteria group bacterium]